MSSCTVHFDRIGRTHDAPDLVTDYTDPDDLADRIFRHARRFLGSSEYEVTVNLEKMRGSIEYGRFGTFTIAEKEPGD